MLHRTPYVGEGADGCRRSARIDREEADCYDVNDSRRERALDSATAWEAQARELDREANVTADIIDVLPGRIRVAARDLQVGDLVHDAMGGTHELVSVLVLKDGTVSTQRDDQRAYHGGRDRWSPDETVTIVRPEV